MNPRSGDVFAREQIEAESKEKVLSSLGTAVLNLRKKLGESLSSIQKYDVPIEQATTSSLDALKAFAMADEERAKGRARESLVLYQRAVELDPNFAMAYARIAVHYVNQEQLEAAKEWIHKAYDLRDRVSERERLYIAEKYYSYVTGEIDKTIETLQTWARLYPDDFVPHNNLAINYKFLGRHEEALKESLEAVRLSPNTTSARENVMTSFIALGRFDEAEQAARELWRINPDSPSSHFSKYFFGFLRRDQAAMDREVQWARGKPDEAQMTSFLAATAMYFGKLKEAEELHKRAVELFKTLNRTENASAELLNFASNLLLFGKCDQAKDKAKASLALFRGQFGVAASAMLFASCGDASQAEQLLEYARANQSEEHSTLIDGGADASRGD